MSIEIEKSIPGLIECKISQSQMSQIKRETHSDYRIIKNTKKSSSKINEAAISNSKIEIITSSKYTGSDS